MEYYILQSHYSPEATISLTHYSQFDELVKKPNPIVTLSLTVQQRGADYLDAQLTALVKI